MQREVLFAGLDSGLDWTLDSGLDSRLDYNAGKVLLTKSSLNVTLQ